MRITLNTVSILRIMSELDMSELTPQQCIFVFEYIRTSHGTNSALAAGYSPRSAYAQATGLLKNVKIRKALGDAVLYRADKLVIDAQWILDELAGLYGAGLDDFTSIGPEGEPYFDFSNVTREQLAKLDSLEISPTKFGTKIKVGLANKRQTLETMGKHVNVDAFREKVELTGNVVLNFDPEDEKA